MLSVTAYSFVSRHDLAFLYIYISHCLKKSMQM